ncbi:MAG TPA: tail fiber domain-containing protein [Candidatus Paceibacterota bacterium]
MSPHIRTIFVFALVTAVVAAAAMPPPDGAPLARLPTLAEVAESASRPAPDLAAPSPGALAGLAAVGGGWSAVVCGVRSAFGSPCTGAAESALPVEPPVNIEPVAGSADAPFAERVIVGRVALPSVNADLLLTRLRDLEERVDALADRPIRETSSNTFKHSRANIDESVDEDVAAAVSGGGSDASFATLAVSATSTLGALVVSGTGTSTVAGSLSVAGNLNFDGAFMQDGAPFVGSQWTTAGSDIYYSTGNVGIATASPYAALSVAGQAVAAYFTATTSTASAFPYASTTALSVSGSAYIGSLTGPLQAIGGLVSATSSIAVIYGGTGASSFGQGWLYSDGGTGTLAASTSPTINYIVATSTTASVLPYASTTAISVSGVASTSQLRIDSVADGCLSVASGLVGSVACGGGSNSKWATSSDSVSIQPNGAGGIIVFASSTIHSLSTTNSTSTNATSTTFYTSGNTILAGVSGSVGIGTTTPGALLAVQGDGYISSGLFVGGAITSTSSSASTFPYASTTALSVSSSAFLAVDGGNVGVGTTSPYAKLSVVGPVVAEYFYATSTTATSSMSILSVGSTTPDGASMFSVGTSTPRIVVNRNTGYVGIGTAAPTAGLTIGSGITIMKFLNTSTIDAGSGGSMTIGAPNGNAYLGNTTLFGATMLVGSARVGIIRDTPLGWSSNTTSYGTLDTTLSRVSTGTIGVATGLAGTATGTLVAGNIGIGTTSPYARLAVHGLANSSVQAYASTLFAVASSTPSATTTHFVIMAGGQVGVGTTTPTSVLSVQGAILSSDLYGGATNVTVDAAGNLIRDPSDQSLKENIEGVTSVAALEKVLLLRGVTFDWKDKEKYGPQREIGFIAQEVDGIVPEAVSAGGEYLSLNVRPLVALVVEGMKAVVARVVSLEEKIATLLAWFAGDGSKLTVQGDVCVDGTCVTKEQFKTILQGAGATTYAVPTPEASGGATTGAVDGGEVATSTGTVAGASTTSGGSSSPEPVVDPASGSGGAVPPEGGGETGTPATAGGDGTTPPSGGGDSGAGGEAGGGASGDSGSTSGTADAGGTSGDGAGDDPSGGSAGIEASGGGAAE